MTQLFTILESTIKTAVAVFVALCIAPLVATWALPFKLGIPPIAGALIVVLFTEALLARPVLKFDWFDTDRQSVEVEKIDWGGRERIKIYEIHASLKSASLVGNRILKRALKHQAEISIGFENGKEVLATVESSSPGSSAQSAGGKVRAYLSDHEDSGGSWIRVTFEIQGERSIKKTERGIKYSWNATGSRIHKKLINVKKGPSSVLL